MSRMPKCKDCGRRLNSTAIFTGVYEDMCCTNSECRRYGHDQSSDTTTYDDIVDAMIQYDLGDFE